MKAPLRTFSAICLLSSIAQLLMAPTGERPSRVADHDVDPLERGPGAINDAPDRRDLGQVELGQPQPVAILGLQVVHDRKVAHGPSDAVAAHEQLLGHDAAEAAAHAGEMSQFLWGICRVSLRL
jgi:hypothetical protein